MPQIAMTVDAFAACVELRQASGSPYWTRHYGLDVRRLSTQEAQELVRQQEAETHALEHLIARLEEVRARERRKQERFLRSKRRRV